MARQRIVYWSVAVAAGVVLGLIYALAYQLSFDIREVAQDAFEPVVLGSLNVSFEVQATVISFLLGFFFAFGVFVTFCPRRMLRDEDAPAETLSLRAFWAFFVVVAGFIAAWIAVEAFYGG